VKKTEIETKFIFVTKISLVWNRFSVGLHVCLGVSIRGIVAKPFPAAC